MDLIHIFIFVCVMKAFLMFIVDKVYFNKDYLAAVFLIYKSYDFIEVVF